MTPEWIAFIKEFGLPVGLLGLVIWRLDPLVASFFESSTRAMKAMEGHGDKLAILNTQQAHIVELAGGAKSAAERAAHAAEALVRALGEEPR